MFYQYAVGLSQIRIVMAQESRTSLVIYNNHASAVIYVGAKAQNFAGFPIQPRGSISFKIPEDDPTGDLWCISDTAATDVRVYEGYKK
mgnify:CR=1 FL=1|jgi:hypothetical protein